MIETLEPNFEGNGLSIGIVQARFNDAIGLGLRQACLTELARLEVEDEDITLVTVPGALEIPLALAKMAETGAFDALIALGAVIRGETYHFEIVANEMAAGVSRVALGAGVPIANGVLTCENEEQAYARMTEKGSDCARTAVEMANLVYALDEAESEATE
jgi:6,7-dimethyl-8-ribityllumazine synthase